MDRVVPAEPVPFRERSRVQSERLVDADDPQLAVQGAQLIDCEAVGLVVDPTGTTGCRHRRSGLGVHELA